MATTDYTNGVTLTDAGEFERFDCAAYAVLTGVAGTNTVTGTGPATYSYLATRPPIWLIPAATNTGATTINVTPSGSSALGAKNVFANGVACVGGELVIGVPTAVIYDGTQFNIIGGLRSGAAWTPVLTFAVPGNLSVAYTIQAGRYIKVGNLVTLIGSIQTSSFTHTTASGNLTITGNPFTTENIGVLYLGTLLFQGITKATYTQITPQIAGAASNIIFITSGSGVNLDAVTAANMPSAGSVILQFSIQFSV